MRKSKYLKVVERLATRIKNGDYHIQGVPSERDLAVEFSVSHMTARKAVLHLIRDGLMIRLSNGRLAVPNKEQNGYGDMQVALLAPAWSSGETDHWHLALAKLAEEFQYSVRQVYYFHPDDPVIRNTISSFKCTFLLPADPFPKNLIVEIQAIDNPLIILNSDWSQHGIPSIRLFPPVFVQKVLDHLAEQGHKRIDCLNTQPGETEIPKRISQWQIWKDAHGLGGNLYNEPVPAFTDHMVGAYTLVSHMIQNAKFDSKALFCVTGPAAFGAMRAMADHGIKAGKDVSVCTADAGLEYQYSVPRLTSMKIQSPMPFLTSCLKWLQSGEKNWVGPLLLQPAEAEVVVGETTV